jgi:hypothetical protein
MYTPGGNRLDSQLLLTPRDYLSKPTAFGSPDAEMISILPLDGNLDSQLVAWNQHRLVVIYRSKEPADRIEARKVFEKRGFSKSTLSRILLGHSWPGAIGLTALQAAAMSRAAVDCARKEPKDF